VLAAALVPLLAFASASAGELAVPSYQPASIFGVSTSELIARTAHPSSGFEPDIAAFDDRVPGVSADGGSYVAMQTGEVAQRILAREGTSDVDGLLLLVSASSDAVWKSVRMTLVDEAGETTSDPDQMVRLLSAGAPSGADAGLPSGLGDSADSSAVRAAELVFDPSLRESAPATDALLARVMIEAIGLKAGSLLVDLVGVRRDEAGGSYLVYSGDADGITRFSAGPPSDAQAAAVPEPGTLGLVLLGALGALGCRQRRRYRR
jgi:hypothetical protein